MTIQERLERLEKRNKRLTAVLTVMAVLISLPSLAHSEVVLSGTPVYRCVTDLSGKAECEKLDEVRSAKLAMSVLRVKPGEYV